MTALYRKYRSAVLADLIGQDDIVRTLSNELRAGKLAHAYLFAGIRGTGKTSTARILARAVNCLEPVDGEPCNRCQACVEILDGSAVDVLEIDAASNRGIDEMRELRERVRYLPARLRSKVYIIDEAHMLTSEAWNAFLKTLEEPPPHVLFILCTTEPHKVPDTVRSRVQRFDFGRVSSARIDDHLRSIAAAEGVELDPAAARLIARAAQGSVRDGLSLLDQCFATGDRPVTLETCRRALGLAHPDVIRALLEGLAGRDAAAALRAAGAAFDAGADPRQLLRECSRLARAAELVAVGFAEGVRLDADEEELCRRLAAQEPDGFWLRVLEEMGAAELELRQPVDARLQVEACLLRLCRGGSARRRRGAPRPARGPAGRAGGPHRAGQAARPRVPAPPVPWRAAARLHRPAPPCRPPRGRSIHARPPRVVASAPRPPPCRLRRRRPRDRPVDTRGARPRGAEPPAAPVPRGRARRTARVRARTELVSPLKRGRGPGRRSSMPSTAATRSSPASCAAAARSTRARIAWWSGRPTTGTSSSWATRPSGRSWSSAVAAVAGGPRELTVEFCGEHRPPRQAAGGDAGAKLTDAVVATFAGSRITSTRLVDHAHDPVDEG